LENTNADELKRKFMNCCSKHLLTKLTFELGVVCRMLCFRCLVVFQFKPRTEEPANGRVLEVILKLFSRKIPCCWWSLWLLW